MLDNNSNFKKISIKYADEVPKDYDISEIQYTFDFIYLVLKRDASIDSAIEGICNEYDISRIDFRNYLIENKYIINKRNMKEFSKQIKSYNRKTLKKILKKHGLKTSGKRKSLEKRIYVNKLLKNNYYLSSKSKIFYKNKKRRIRIYNKYLFNHYYFKEFNEFYMDNFRKKEYNIPIEYVNMYIDKSVEDKDHEMYILNNEVLLDFYLKNEKPKKMMECVLKNYCININPIWKINHLNSHEAISKECYENIQLLFKKFGKNVIINTFYLMWDSFDFDRIIVPKYDAYRILKDMMNLKEIAKINHDLKNRFYMNKDLKIKKITQKSLFEF